MKNLFGTLLLALALSLTACGSEDATDASATGGDDTTSQTDTTPAGDGTVHTVDTSDSSMDFDPKDLTIAVGDVVRFVMICVDIFETTNLRD